jgi:hypothetical protein
MDWRGAAKGGTQIAGTDVPLRNRLTEIRQNVEALLPAEKLAPVERAVADLQATGL